MKMTAHLLRSLLMLLAGLAISAQAAYAQADGSIMEQIGLTEAQRSQIQKLRDGFLRETEETRTDIKKLLDEEKRLRATSPVNESALRRVLTERAQKEIELTLALNRFNERVEKVLTAPQRDKMRALQEKVQQRR